MYSPCYDRDDGTRYVQFFQGVLILSISFHRNSDRMSILIWSLQVVNDVVKMWMHDANDCSCHYIAKSCFDLLHKLLKNRMSTVLWSLQVVNDVVKLWMHDSNDCLCHYIAKSFLICYICPLIAWIVNCRVTDEDYFRYDLNSLASKWSNQ